MTHSTVTSKGQTTIPGEVRAALNIKPGDQLQYTVEGNQVRVQVYPGTRSLAGALSSKKGKDMSFDEIRKAAAQVAAKKKR